MRGRVMALRVGVALGGMTIGAPILGWVAKQSGPRWSLAMGAGAPKSRSVNTRVTISPCPPTAGASDRGKTAQLKPGHAKNDPLFGP